jgi:peptidoglycan hydrolase-like protein with peptidoglycan-binding domain
MADAIPPVGSGSTVNIVFALQHALIANGYAVAPLDGNFSPATIAALEAFQGDKALPVRPLCDKACWAALGPQ